MTASPRGPGLWTPPGVALRSVYGLPPRNAAAAPPTPPPGTSATQLEGVYAVQPILAAIETIAAHCDA